MEPLDLAKLLEDNPYPGRGILLGLSANGRFSITAYFIMGRSENSRNRVFVPTEDGICTQAHDLSRMTDSSLIIYHPVRLVDGNLIVTNGDQTDTVRDAILTRRSPYQALHTRKFEPDEPNYTPRISGLIRPDGSFFLSILKSADGDPGCCCRHFYTYDRPRPGEGRLLHTYQGDGDPLPSFEGEPKRVLLEDPTPEALAERLWNALNSENKVSLFVRFIDLADGSHRDVIRNKLG